MDLVVTNIILDTQEYLSKLVDKTRGLGRDQYNSDTQEYLSKLVDKTRGLGRDQYNSDTQEYLSKLVDLVVTNS